MPKNVVCKKCKNLVNDWCEKVIDSPDQNMQRDCQYFCEKTNDDVAPVVRCKDCKYYRVSAMLAPNKFCFRLKHPVEDRSIGYNFAPDDFCSHGKLKEPR